MSFAQHLQLVLDPAFHLDIYPHQFEIDLGEHRFSWYICLGEFQYQGYGKLQYNGQTQGFRKLRRDELMQLMQLMRRLQASPHVILLNLHGHKFGTATMQEMAAPIAALSELQAHVLAGT